MKSKFLLPLAISAFLLVGNACKADDENCEGEPELCACINNPLRCVSPVGIANVPSDSLEAVSKLPVKE